MKRIDASSWLKREGHSDNSGVHDEDKPTKSGRTPRLLLALPPAVKDAIERSARLNSRTVTAEINERLKASLKMDADDIPAHLRGVVATSAPVSERSQPAGPNDAERQLVNHFRELAADKQLALLTLLKR